jgi:hypothetical protein
MFTVEKNQVLLMIIPPIQPTGQPSELPGGGPIRERVLHAIASIQERTGSLQAALAAHDSLAHIDSLLQHMQQPVQDLVQLAGRRPPVMSQNEIDVVGTLYTQYELASMDSQTVSPAAAAAIQGSSSTLGQMFAAEAAGIPEPNTTVLQALNYLSALSEALHKHLKIKSKESGQIIDAMQTPMKELEHLSSLGVFPSQHTEALEQIKATYHTVIQDPELATPQTLNPFQTALQTLTHLLTS